MVSLLCWDLGNRLSSMCCQKLSVWPGTNCCSVPPRSAGAAELSDEHQVLQGTAIKL